MRIVITVALIGGALFPVGQDASAQSAANIEFLNPSSFAAVPAPNSPNPDVPKGPDTLVVSDNPTANPDAGPEAYRLSAWVSGAPQTPAVEFELLTRGGVSLEIIDDVTRVGSDTFEADWDISDTLPDGPYTLRATLASGVLGVDSVDQDIVIQRTAERAEITYPDNRSGEGQYGMYARLPLTGSGDSAAAEPTVIGNIENRQTGAAPGRGPGQVRAFYTTSAPGTAPDWKVCGTETGFGSFPFDDASDGMRCTLQSAAELPSVTAVALVANTTKIGQPYERTANQSGDATRVVQPYSQVPTKLVISLGQSATVASGGDCHEVVADLTDQFTREIAGANMDAHAWGPTDRLRLGTGPVDAWSREAPDRGGHAREAGMDCWSGQEDNPENGDQGEHQVIGGPDLKHIEADEDGTDDNGQWGFQAYLPADIATPERHTTYWELWLDESNDGSGWNNDVFDSVELCQSGLIGWDSSASNEPMSGATPSCPNSPPPSPCDTTSSQTTQPCPTTSPSPSPTPTASPTAPPQDDGTITLSASRRKVSVGKRVRFSGVVDSSDGCTPGRQIVLQSRRPGKSFRNRVLTASSPDGSWSTRRRLRKTTEWRVLARSVGECEELRSSIVKIRVTRN